MSFLKRLRRLLRNERGNVLLIGAATMPLIIGAAAFAIDTTQIAVWKRQLQRAADSAAIAGAYAVAAGTDTHDSVHHDLDNNRFPMMSQAEVITEGPAYGYQKTVRVQITASPNLPFMKVFGVPSATLRGDATAALVNDGTYCMVSLYDGNNAGIDIGGNADVVLGCGMKTNSKSSSAVTITGSANLKATPIAAVGGIPSSSKYLAGTTLQPFAAPQVDPLGWVPNPDTTSCSTATLDASNYSTLIPSGGGTVCVAAVNIQPSDHITLPNNVTLVVNGGDVNLQGDLTASSFTLVMTGPNGAAGDLKINAQANLVLSAPNSGPYTGVVMYRDRRAANINIKMNGGASSVINGALYFPSSDLEFNGNSSMNTQCLQMVGRILTFKGGINIQNHCDPAGGPHAFRQTVVRLVG
jgi:Flp pilus assembly protein TadG